MILERYFQERDVIEFNNADQPSWADGLWRVAGFVHVVGGGERAEILPLTATEELDAIRACCYRYFVTIDKFGRSGLEEQRVDGLDY